MLETNNNFPRYYIYITAGLFALLLVYLFNLQILNSERFKGISEKNYVRLRNIAPIRGELYDREFQPIVLNRSSYNLYITPASIENKDNLVSFLSANFKISLDEFKDFLYKNRFRHHHELILAQNIGFETVIKTSEHLNYFPSLTFKSETIREYQYPNHFTGYVGRINDQEYARLSDSGYTINSVIGKSGLERQYEQLLRGENGYEIMQVDARGRSLNLFKHNLYKPAEHGKTLVLSIDNRLQNYITSILPEEHNSAVVVMDVSTGGILAYVSQPEYDLNMFSVRISSLDWESLMTDQRRPMLDRVIHATYPPASVYKPIIASIGWDEGLLDLETEFAECTGGMQIGDRFFNCWYEDGHGKLSLIDAMKHSCDVYFYDLSLLLSLEVLEQKTKENHFTVHTGIDIPGERRGFFPNRRWYIENYGRNISITGQKVNLSIGQGEMLITPLQVCAYYNAIANNGNWIKPHLLDRIVDKDIVRVVDPEIEPLPYAKENIEAIQHSLYATVNERYGTGMAARYPGVDVYGKTGSAENHMGSETHAWFAGYAKWDSEPEIAFVVFLENAGGGGSVAAPIARRIIGYYNEIREQ
jgi:penicillin-binding protein 2